MTSPVSVENTPVAAAQIVAVAFDPTSDRYRHLAGAAAVAHQVGADLLPPTERDVLVCAVWLHDLGYAVPRTGFHSVDGALWLLERSWSPRIAALVAHHSLARMVAAEAGATSELQQFPLEEGLLHDLLIYCDMSVSPTGQPVSLGERLRDIATRHSFETATGRVHADRAVALESAVQRVQQRLASQFEVAATA